MPDPKQIVYEIKYQELVSKAAVRTQRQLEACRLYKDGSPEHTQAIAQIDAELTTEVATLNEEVGRLGKELKVNGY